jgi:phosphopentomutase
VHTAAQPRCGTARGSGNLIAPNSEEITTMTDLSELDAMLADLRRKAAKRRDVAGYAANLEALEARIADLEARRIAALATSN